MTLPEDLPGNQRIRRHVHPSSNSRVSHSGTWNGWRKVNYESRPPPDLPVVSEARDFRKRSLAIPRNTPEVPLALREAEALMGLVLHFVVTFHPRLCQHILLSTSEYSQIHFVWTFRLNTSDKPSCDWERGLSHSSFGKVFALGGIASMLLQVSMLLQASMLLQVVDRPMSLSRRPMKRHEITRRGECRVWLPPAQAVTFWQHFEPGSFQILHNYDLLVRF